MSTATSYPHIVQTPGEPACLSAQPRTRVSMIVADYLWRGWSAEEIARQYPHLSLAEVHAALAYYFDHKQEIDGELASEDQQARDWRKSHPSPPLLVRLKEQARL